MKFLRKLGILRKNITDLIEEAGGPGCILMDSQGDLWKVVDQCWSGHFCVSYPDKKKCKYIPYNNKNHSVFKNREE